jgi:hypothetical protein
MASASKREGDRANYVGRLGQRMLQHTLNWWLLQYRRFYRWLL